MLEELAAARHRPYEAFTEMGLQLPEGARSANAAACSEPRCEACMYMCRAQILAVLIATASAIRR